MPTLEPSCSKIQAMGVTFLFDLLEMLFFIIMCLFHDFSELDLTKVSMIKVVPKMKSKVVTKVVIKDWDFSTLAHLLLYNSVGVDGTLVGTDSQLDAVS